MSLRDKTIACMFWSLLQNIGSQCFTFLVMVILARLLTAGMCGLTAMLMIFIQVSQVLIIAGFNQALIQRKVVSDEDYSSVFWINLVVSFFLYGVTFFCAPLIADFYSQPILLWLTDRKSVV